MELELLVVFFIDVRIDFNNIYICLVKIYNISLIFDFLGDVLDVFFLNFLDGLYLNVEG